MIICKEEMNAIVLLFIVILMLIGYALFMETTGIDSFASSHSDEASMGTLVVLSGTAENVRTIQTGGHVTASVNGVKVFVPGNIFCPDFDDGDYIRVSGVVDEYMDSMEIRAIKVGVLKKTY